VCDINLNDLYTMVKVILIPIEAARKRRNVFISTDWSADSDENTDVCM